MPVISANARIPLSNCLDIEKIKSYLTVTNPEYTAKSRFGTFYSDMPDELLCYFILEHDHIIVPRNFHRLHPNLFSGLGEDTITKLNNRRLAKDARFTAIPRDYQQKFFDGIDDTPVTCLDMLIEAGCGTGKTLMSCRYVITYGMTALVLVPTYAIADQWLKTFDAHTENVSCEIANPKTLQKLIDAKDLPDVLVMSFDLFDARQLNLNDYFCTYWGTVVLDEAHRTGAPSYQPVLEIVPCSQRIACTATFRRQDGMHRILEYFFGQKFTLPNPFDKVMAYAFETGIDIPVMIPFEKIPGGKRLRDKNREVFETWLTDKGVPYSHLLGELLTVDLKLAKDALKVPDFKLQTEKRLIISGCIAKMVNYHRENMFSTVDSYVARCGYRRRIMLTLMMHCVNTGRKVLFISKRKESLFRYKDFLESIGIKVGLVIGDTSKNSEHLQYCRDTAQVVLCIYQIGKEGLDMPTVDTLLLEHAFSDLEQLAGRTNRIMAGKKRSLLLFPYDGYMPYRRLYTSASKLNHKAVDFCSARPLQEILTRID